MDNVVLYVVFFVLGLVSGVLIFWKIYKDVERQEREIMIERLCRELADRLGIDYDDMFE